MVDSVVFLHGLGGSPLSWEAQTAALPPHLLAAAPWLYGMRPGRSGQGETFTLEAAARHLARTVELEHGGHAALVGHSLGAMVALQCALDRPEIVDRLVLIAGQANPSRSALRVQNVLLRFIPQERLGSVSKARLRAIAAEVGKAALGAHLPEILAPTLVMVGSKDRVNIPAAHTLADGIPGGQLEVVPDGGHLVMRDQPEVVNRLLYDFLA